LTEVAGINIAERMDPMKTVEEITARRDIVEYSIRTCRNSLFLPGLRSELATLNWILGEGDPSTMGIRAKKE
jgi:hypothetical protein